MIKFLFLFFFIACTGISQAPPETALSLLEKLLIEFKAPTQPPPQIFYGGQDTTDTVLLRELEDRKQTILKRMALIQEIENFIRDEKLKSTERVRTIPKS